MECNVFKLRISALCLILCMTLFEWAVPTLAQETSERVISGKISDLTTGEVLPGVSISLKGSTQGTLTDANGAYQLKVPTTGTLEVSFVGYSRETIQIENAQSFDFTLVPSIETLNEVVVVGYGTQRKGDLTGAVSSVSTKDFNRGIISTPAELINGKVAGVQIMSNSGSPTGGSTIRIRGGASLNASNDPLIVLDGVPLENGGISGNDNNFMSLINPNDIESMTILKDASSTAIYGSRASNGVIIITTKKAKDSKLKIDFSTTNSVQVKTKLADMLSRDEFIDVVNTEGTAAQKALIGTANTDWNDEIYQAAFGTDNNLSLSGTVKKVPYRVSVGLYDQNGIVKTDHAKRFSGNLSVAPTFFDDHLKLNIGAKASANKNRFAATDAVWGAATFNPTLPVYSGSNRYGGYTEAIDGNGDPVNSAVLNPLGILNQYASTSEVNRFIGNFDVDYKLHFLPELRFHSTLAYDYAEGKGKVAVADSAMQYYTTGGRNYEYGPQKLENKLLTTYFNYNKDLKDINSTLDVTLGYDYQFWKSAKPFYEEKNVAGTVQTTSAATDERHALISYYGRVNYALLSRYLLTATIRYDGSSRFSENNRWGTFPSMAVAWRLSEEAFLKDIKVLSNLKLRASYGATGQQDGIGNYSYLPIYTQSQAGAQYLFSSDTVSTYRPEAYVKDLTWESTEAYNYGIDFGFLNERITGSFEYYTRTTRNLLATVASPGGTNFEKEITTNVGNVDSKGYEFSINGKAIDTKDLTWDLSFNATWQTQKIKNLSINGAKGKDRLAGPTIDSYQFQVLSEGYAPYMFYVYHQLYDENGKPIEGAYADADWDGEVNTRDLYRYHRPAPDYILGFSTSLRYKNLTLSTSLRANIGNYVYNGMAMNSGAFGTMSYNAYQLNNLNKSYLETGFQSRQYLSDYYVENASFLKMDNLIVSYTFGQVLGLNNVSVSGMVQNVFTVTKYSGVDPEVPDGMDNSFYPRPRIYSVSLGINF